MIHVQSDIGRKQDDACDSTTGLGVPRWLSRVCTTVEEGGVFPVSDVTVETSKPPIDIAAGIPDPTQLAYRQMRQAISQVLCDTSRAFSALSYGDPLGELSLREWVAGFRNVDVDSVIITNGAMEAIFLSAIATLDPGDTVIVEHRSFPQAARIFSRLGMRLRSVPLTPQGVDIEALNRLLESQRVGGNRIKAIYTIPNFQNPTGISASADTNRKLLELAEHHGIAVIADDPYHDLWFSQPPAEFPGEYRGTSGSPLLEIGSFSKWLGPGLRVGWLIADPAAVRKIAGYRLGVDGGPATLTQYALSQVLQGSWGNQWLAAERRFYAEKAKALLETLQCRLGEDIDVLPPQGGYFLWARLPEWFNSSAASVRRALAIQGINPVWGNVFTSPSEIDAGQPDDDARHCMRLSFAHVSKNRLEQVADRLRDALDEVRPSH